MIINLTCSASRGNEEAVTTGGTGAAYTAIVPGISELTAGVKITIIPHTVSTSTAPTLDVNGLGAKAIQRRLSSDGTSLHEGYSASWLAAGVPFTLLYDGTCWIVEGQTRPAASDLSGTLAIDKGGTGKTTAAAGLYALINGTSALASSDLATGDYVALGDVSASIGKKVTLANLASWLADNGCGVDYKIVYGSFSCTPSSTGKSTTVSFSSIGFASAPVIVASCTTKSGSSGLDGVYVNSVNASQATFIAKTDSTQSSMTVYYIAIGV